MRRQRPPNDVADQIAPTRPPFAAGRPPAFGKAGRRPNPPEPLDKCRVGQAVNLKHFPSDPFPNLADWALPCLTFPAAAFGQRYGREPAGALTEAVPPGTGSPASSLS